VFVVDFKLMARFVDTAESQAALIRIIKNSESDLYIISPYTKISGQTKEYIKNIDKTAINFKIISRMETKSDTNVPVDDIQFLRELQNTKILVCQNLHAKCYLNEKEGLITSLNLHEHSQISNWEMGISFSKDGDPEIYNSAIKEIRHLEERSIENPKVRKEINNSKLPTHKPEIPTTPTLQTTAIQQPVYPSWYIPPVTQAKVPTHKPKEDPRKGLFTKIIDSVIGEEAYCIRCGHSMGKFNLEKPLCDKCYPKWAQFKKKDYPERLCHACGELKSNISYEKPICRGCFNRLYK
jgi:hypothetical protein